ncbi:sulfotransferase 1C2-like [Gigantopelta aegis]|uniref:sulfotransferase 1C2-like n=1 Tax=Gigantopelta aegis TaxID=1735272 RepID=UPI001B8893D2|nr:sulfotransferase 1C2-like [Gigantopelta aegis]
MALYDLVDDSGNVFRVRRVGSRFFKPSRQDFNEEEFVTHIQSIRSLPTSSDDVFICSYPKCGTHWVYDICQMLESKDVAKNPLRIFEFPREGGFESPVTVGSHLYPHELPDDILKKKSRLIRVCRNPKDVAVSYYFFIGENSTNDLFPYKGNWSDFFQLFIEGRLTYNSYFDYIDIWSAFEQEHPGFVHVVFYEHLHKDPAREIRRLGKFLGVDPSLLEDTVFIEDIVKTCCFQNIKDLKKIKHPGEYRLFVDRLWRKGEVGDWKNYFTVAQNEAMDRVIQQRLQHHDISFIYEL